MLIQLKTIKSDKRFQKKTQNENSLVRKINKQTKLCQKYKVELTKRKAQNFCFNWFCFCFFFIFFKIWHEILIILTEHNLGNLFLIIEIHSPLSHSFQINVFLVF